MCNTSNQCGNNGSDQSDELWDLITTINTSPAVVGIQEVCRYPTYNTLRAAFLYSGYQARFLPYKDNSDCHHPTEALEQVGIAVFWVGGCYQNDCTIAEYYEDQWPDDSDERGVICGRGAFPALQGCNTHITFENNPTPYARRQVEEYTALMGFLNGYVPAFGTGDFNRQPTWPALDDMYTTWHEGDGDPGSDWRGTFIPNNEKLDYVWIPRATHHRAHDLQLIAHIDSDHRFLRGYPAED